MFIESLESRTLFSVSAVNPQIEADRLAVKAALLAFKADCVSYTAKLLADCQALQADDVKQDAVLAPLFKTLRTDVQAMQTQLKSDNLAEAGAVLADQSVIVAEKEQILKDQGNPTALAADRAQLLVDYVQLQNDEITGLNARLATRQGDYDQLSTDLSAIATAVETDPNASPKLQADVTTFVDDRTDALNDLTSDLQAIIVARTQLAADLTALE
jgi:hypothetical protein